MSVAENKQTMKTPEKKVASVKKEAGPRVMRRYISRREAIEAARRFHSIDGKRVVDRFTLGQRIEHYVLLISFTLLGITGLSQTFSSTSIGYFILTLLGGIDSTRVIHHTAAFIFGMLAIYHVAVFLYQFFMGHRLPKMMPEWSDFTQLVEMLKLDLGLSKKHPWFDRFNFEEKAEYWALVWGTVVMGMTGLMQWFPVATTYYLPGGAIPVARAFHKWEAILAVLAILVWHMYHTVIKKLNTSIFTGVMTMEEMEEEHPQELAYLEAAAAVVDSRSWPVLIEVPQEEEKEPEPVAAPVEEKKEPEVEQVVPPVEEATISEVPASPGTEESPTETENPKTNGEEE
jgi:cytochrome b subunit of formate dehydrogenase